MRLLAISGSVRRGSTNAALLAELMAIAPPDVEARLYQGLRDLPIFDPELEGAATPAPARALVEAVERADGLVIASPEYVRAMPGGLKNAIDWLAPREAVIGKPIALIHASHRGDDALDELRRVLSTISERFDPECFARFPLMAKTPEEVRAILAAPEHAAALRGFLERFLALVAAPR